MLEMRGSDLHLTAGAPPTVRVDGSLRPIPDMPELAQDTLQHVIYAILTQRQRETLRGEPRARLRLLRCRGAAVPGQRLPAARLLGAVFRVIPYEIKTLEDLGMPPATSNFAGSAARLVLVTGRPAPASRPRWPRSSTSSTAPGTTTS